MNNKKIKKLKSIAFVVWLFPKLSETFVLNQIVQLKKRGYRISIFAVKDPRKELAREDYEFEQIVHGDIKKHRLLNLTKYGSPEKLAYLLKNGTKKKEIDIAYFQFPDLAAEIFKYGKLQCPTISVFHNLPKPRNKREFAALRKKYEIVFKNITFILAISEFAKNELIKLGCKKHKILVHHMGIDAEIFKPANVKLSTDPFTFIMVGRFVEKKGFKYGIRSFHKIIQKYPNRHTSLLIIGDGILRNALQEEVKQLKLKKYVHFFGKVPQKKLLKVLRSTHCLVCPSITTRKGKREGLPIVIMEAAACGIPIIATHHTAIPEILSDGRGFLVKEKSIRELSEAMEEVHQNYREVKEKIAKKARQLVIQEYNIEKLVKRLIKIFNLARDIRKQKMALEKFSDYIKKYLSYEVFSIMTVGSIARHESLTKESDIDLIIVFQNQTSISPEALLKLNKAINLLRKNSGLQVTPQIFTRFDLFQLLSPVLMKNYIEDREVVYGKDLIKFFQEKLSRLSDFEYDMAILKRCLFERYFLRQYIATYPRKLNYAFYNRLAKTVLFLARDFLYLTEGITITKREKIAKTFLMKHKNKIPFHALQIMKSKKGLRNVDLPSLFHLKSIDFVERVCSKIIKFIKEKYPNKKIYVSPF